MGRLDVAVTVLRTRKLMTINGKNIVEIFFGDMYNETISYPLYWNCIGAVHK